jgi:regulator of protease activity HflC (stomatin/prohibitin superfamily)
MLGMMAGRSVATEATSFLSFHTLLWGLIGVVLIFVPAWLLLRMGIAFCGIFLLPIMPSKHKRRSQAGRVLRAYMWGLNHPIYREVNGKLEKRVEGSLLLPQAGPGFVMASSHYAIPLTTGPEDAQVGGHGFVFTGRKERPRDLIDLRLQTQAKAVHALTLDGISVSVMIFAIFQIDRRGAKGGGLYPYDPNAVLKAVHTNGVGPDGEEVGWEEVVTECAADMLRDAFARKRLDQLLSSGDGQEPPREVIRKEVADQLGPEMRPYGIDVKAIGIGNIEVEDEEILAQRVESWASRWERRRLARESEGEAEAIRLLEKARASVQRQMIGAITEAFQQLSETQTPMPPYVIALRFIDILENLTTSSELQNWLPQAVEYMPSRLRSAVERDLDRQDESPG